MAASLAKLSTQATSYFSLSEQNQRLAQENAVLRQRLLQNADTSPLKKEVPDAMPTSLAAKVVDHSVLFRKNYLTIDKGAADGVKPGNGRGRSRRYCGAGLAHHHSLCFGALFAAQPVDGLCPAPTYENAFAASCGTAKTPLSANVKYLPRHVDVQPGDSIVTSGYSSIYPSGYLIGVVSNAEKGGDGAFSEVQIKLSTRFYQLSYVYLLAIEAQEEKDSLDIKTATTLDE